MMNVFFISFVLGVGVCLAHTPSTQGGQGQTEAAVPLACGGFAQWPHGLTLGVTDMCQHWLSPGPHATEPNHHILQTEGFLLCLD